MTITEYLPAIGRAPWQLKAAIVLCLTTAAWALFGAFFAIIFIW